MKNNTLLLLMLVLAGTMTTVLAAPMGKVFTYQGKLPDGDAPANGSYIFASRCSER